MRVSIVPAMQWNFIASFQEWSAGAYHRFGIDMSNLDKYESGELEPGLAIIMLFAKMLDVNHRDLMNFDFEFELKP
jgi:hypothetical protein